MNRFEEKAAFATLPDLYPFPTPAIAAVRCNQESGRDRPDVEDAPRRHARLDAAARRMGRSAHGLFADRVTNHPASPEATGLEVDKLNPRLRESYFDHYLDKYKDTVGPLMGKRGFQYVITDSWEAGVQNWTDNMIAEFTKRRGYDPRSRGCRC